MEGWRDAGGGQGWRYQVRIRVGTRPKFACNTYLKAPKSQVLLKKIGSCLVSYGSLCSSENRHR